MTLTPFNPAFDPAFGAPPPQPEPPDYTGDGAVGTGPYGDGTEFVEWVTPPAAPITYPPFHPTDARAVEIYLEPLHYNLIPNPSFRANADRWSISPGLVLDQDSWVGQSLVFDGDGEVHHDKIWVGPEGRFTSGDSDWYESRLGLGEYTFSMFAKGENLQVQLSLYGYRPKDLAADTPEPEDTPSSEIHSPVMTVNADDWERYYVKTTSRMADISDSTSDFIGCWWVEPRVEITQPSSIYTSSLLLSSFLLDLTEGPLCDYFDGDMNEGGLRDDYIWIYDRQGNQRFSAYYPQRVERCQWLHRHLYDAVPVNRPVHIYYHDRTNAWDPGGPPPHELTGQLRVSHDDGASMVEVAVSRYGNLASPLP